MISIRFVSILLLINLTVGYSFQASGQEDSDDSQSYQKFSKFLIQLNRYTPIEGAGSHGSYGTHVGFGINRYQSGLSSRNYYYQYAMDDEKTISSKSVDLTKAYLIKGSLFPIDVGLVFGSDNTTSISQLGAHIQWTFFEGLKIPALAVRGHYSALLGLTDTRFSSYGADFLVSYGVLRYFNLYLGVGGQYSHLEITVADTDKTALAPSGQASIHKSDRISSYGTIAGIKANIVPALLSLSGEYQMSEEQQSSMAAKLSLIF